MVKLPKRFEDFVKIQRRQGSQKICCIVTTTVILIVFGLGLTVAVAAAWFTDCLGNCKYGN